MNPILLALIIFFAIFTQSLTGFGLGLVSMALLVALVAITSETIILIRYRHAFNLSAVRRLVTASIVGIPLGIIFLRVVSQEIGLTILGLGLVAYGLYALFTPRLPQIRNPRWAYGFGFVAGLLTGAYNTGGPPSSRAIYRASSSSTV